MGNDDPSSGCIVCKFGNGEFYQALYLLHHLQYRPLSPAPLLFFDETWKAWQIAQDVLRLVFPAPSRWNGSRTCAHGTGVANEQHSSKAIHCCHLPVTPWPHFHIDQVCLQHLAASEECSAERHRSSRGTEWCPTCRELATISKNHYVVVAHASKMHGSPFCDLTRRLRWDPPTGASFQLSRDCVTPRCSLSHRRYRSIHLCKSCSKMLKACSKR